MFGLSFLTSKVAIYAGGALIIVLAILLYGHTRYTAGKHHEDAKWEAASKKTEALAVKSTAAADKGSAARIVVHDQQVQQEKEKIDEAEQNGSSPLDVLFGN